MTGKTRRIINKSRIGLNPAFLFAKINKHTMDRREKLKEKIVIYKTQKGPEFEVRLKEETVWLTQKQIAELFNSERSVITKHLKNIFDSAELIEKSNVQKMHIAGSDKPVKF
ncbi:MAG: hypothetical protein Q7R84_02095, partial [bacterium]|nr:hypothetical protein [bacterium]